MKVYLVRHGQSVGNLKNLWYGSSDLPLTDLGREMLQKELQRLSELLENGKRLLGGSEQ